MRRIHGLLAVLAILACAAEARASETYHTCAGFITSVPATISTQGVWCLRRDLSTAVTSGAAITIASNNVTLDCNGFKLGGLAAGAASQTVGVRATGRQNATVRNCSIRGFFKGVHLDGGAGHLVEGNRFDNNLHIGVHVSADSGEVRGNLVYDTGGSPAAGVVLGPSTIVTPVVLGIVAHGAHVTGNSVDGLFGPDSGYYGVWGIGVVGSGIEVSGNRLRNLSATGSGGGLAAIVSLGSGVIRDNAASALMVAAGRASEGVSANGSTRCKDNFLGNFATPVVNCPGL